MLWADFKPQHEAELAVIGLNALLMGVVSGAIPFATGLATRKVGLAVVAGLVAAATGAVFEWFVAIPVALFLAGVIMIVHQVTRPSPPALIAAAEEEYELWARPFQLPGSKDEPTGGLSDGDRDRRHVEKYGFKPPPRRADPVD